MPLSSCINTLKILVCALNVSSFTIFFILTFASKFSLSCYIFVIWVDYTKELLVQSTASVYQTGMCS